MWINLDISQEENKEQIIIKEENKGLLQTNSPS